MADLINSYIAQGTIVPVKITIELIEKAMKASGGTKFLIDGFPRNAENLEGWESQMKGVATVKFVLFLDCDAEECVKRVLGRAAGGSDRIDDNEATLRKRFATYESETKPVLALFEERGLVRRVHGARPVDEVFAEVSELFKDL